MSNQTPCPGCGRGCSKQLRHEAKLVAQEASKHLCPPCLLEIVRGMPGLKDRIRVLEGQVADLKRGRR